MPTLVFPAPGFTTSTQFTSTFSTFSITVPGLVASRAKMKSVDPRSFGKVLPRTNIRGPVDRRSYGKVLPRSNIVSVPINLALPKITTFKVPSKNISTIENNYSIVSKLSPFVNQGLTSGLTYPVGGQSTIINNSINYIINDLDILATSTTASGSSQTLYFNPESSFVDPMKLTFNIGDYVKITNNDNFTEVVEITTSTVSSITFDVVSNLPVNELGGLNIQLVSADLYPTTATLASYYANLSTTGIQITPATPRENLAISQMELPSLRYRSQRYYIDKELADTLPLLNSTTNSLSTFSDDRIPGDFRIIVTGQTSYRIDDTVNWYLFDNDILANKLFGTLSDNSGKIIVTENGLSITSLDSIKTVNFPQQDATPFPSGSSVRLINDSTGYKQEFTVITGTGNSVSFVNPENLPVGGLTIEQTVASVYPQSFVSTRVAPINARENLYYFNISPGLRAGEQYFISSGDARLSNGNLSKQLSSLRSPTTQLSVAKLSSAAQLKADSTILRVNTLRSAAKLTTTGFTQPRLFVSTITNFYSQLTVAPRGTPTNARETFFYFNLAPGLRANRTIINGEIIGNSFLTTNLGLIRQPQSNFVDIGTRLIKTGNLKSSSKLISDTAKFNKIEYINPFKIRSNQVQFFETPRSSKLLSVVSLKSDRNLFNPESIQKPILTLIYDTAKFKIDSLSNVSKLKADGLKFKYEQLAVFKIRSNTTKVFETPLIGKIRPFSYIFTTFSDRALNTGNLKSTAKLVGADGVFNNERLDEFTFLRPVNGVFKSEQIKLFKIQSNTTEIFETPKSSKLLSVASLKSDKNIFRIDKLSSTSVMRADNARLTSGKLKSSAVLTEYGDSKKLYRPDSFYNYINQTTVRPITAPTNASERFYYFNLAPGYRRNLSIQQGKVFEPPNSIIKNDRLELFDNIGYQLDLSRIYNVSGQTTGVTANTVLFYQDDLDILTATTTQINSVTIFFENSERISLKPFNVGDTVYVTKIQDLVAMATQGFVFTVLASSFYSVTIAKPADWDITWTFSTIQSTSAEYYPRAAVRTNVAPTNAREALYYAELGPGIRTNRTISYGNSLADTGRIKDIDAAIFKYIAGKTGTGGFIDTSGNLVISTLTKDIFKLRGLRRVTTVSLLNKDILKLRAIPVRDSKGIIIKLIVGDGKRGANGFTDTGARKKEPIQFWN